MLHVVKEKAVETVMCITCDIPKKVMFKLKLKGKIEVWEGFPGRRSIVCKYKVFIY